MSKVVPTPVEPAAASLPVVAPFRVLGSASSRWVSVLTVAALVLLWAVASARSWVPPLFLPGPPAVWKALVDAWQGNIQGGEPLLVHLQWSAIRVFGAFALAVLTAMVFTRFSRMKGSEVETEGKVQSVSPAITLRITSAPER